MSTPSAPQRPLAATRSAPDRTLESNAYAVAFRLLGDRAAAATVASDSARQLRATGAADRPSWLYDLTLATLDRAVEVGRQTPPPAGDEHAGLRAALRRRLAHASPEERVAAALIHLAGYPAEFAGPVVQRDTAGAAELARVIAPPPGVAYRELGDPELTHAPAHRDQTERTRSLRPRLTTLVVVALVVMAVVIATQITGPRPTLGPPVEEGSAARTVEAPAAGGAPATGQRNGGPLTQQTSE